MLQIKLNHSGGAAMNMSANPYVIVYARAHVCPRSDKKLFSARHLSRSRQSIFGDTYWRFTVLITRILIRPGDIFCFQSGNRGTSFIRPAHSRFKFNHNEEAIKIAIVHGIEPIAASS